MSTVRKIVGWVRGLGKVFIFLRKIPTERVSKPVLASVHTIGTGRDEKNYRLAEIARERNALIANKAEILRKRKPFYRLLRELRDEEMRLELRR